MQHEAQPFLVAILGLFVPKWSWSLTRLRFFALALVVGVGSGLNVDHWLEASRGQKWKQCSMSHNHAAFFFGPFAPKWSWTLIRSSFLALGVTTGDVGAVWEVEQCRANKVTTQGETGLGMP